MNGISIHQGLLKTDKSSIPIQKITSLEIKASDDDGFLPALGAFVCTGLTLMFAWYTFTTGWRYIFMTLIMASCALGCVLAAMQQRKSHVIAIKLIGGESVDVVFANKGTDLDACRQELEAMLIAAGWNG